MQLQIEAQRSIVQARPAHGMQTPADVRSALLEENLRPPGEGQELAPVHGELRGVAQNRPALAGHLLVGGFEARGLRQITGGGHVHAAGPMDDVAQRTRQRIGGGALEGETHQNREGAVVRMQIEQRRQDQQGRAPVPEGGRQTLHSSSVPRNDQIGDRLIGKTQKEGVVGGETQLGEGRQRLRAPPAAEPGAVIRSDADAPLDQELRPGIIVAVRGEDHPCPPAAGDGALQKGPRRQRFVVRVRRQEQQALSGGRSVPAHGAPPAGAKGEKPRSAAPAQITASRPPPDAGRKSCPPGGRSRGPSYGSPSSLPRAASISATMA